MQSVESQRLLLAAVYITCFRFIAQLLATMQSAMCERTAALFCLMLLLTNGIRCCAQFGHRTVTHTCHILDRVVSPPSGRRNDIINTVIYVYRFIR